MLACRDWLRQNLNVAGVGPESVELMFDGRPAPRCGDWFVAVHEGEWRVDEAIGAADLSLPEAFGVTVTVTRKCGVAPFDRVGTDVLAAATKGLLAVCRRVLVCLHMSYRVTDAANAAIGTTANGFFHPLVFRGASATVPQGPAWFNARGVKSNPPCGLSRALSFANAQRVQTLESMT